MKYFNYFGLGILFFLPLVAGNGCGKDTCNEEKTFSQIEASLTDTLPITLNIQTLPYDVLPEAYFQEFHKVTGDQGYSFDNLNWQNDYAFIDSFRVAGKSNLTLFLHDSLKSDLSRIYKFHFSLPDRMKFIECSHPGSRYTYFLDFDLKVKRDLGVLLLDVFGWKETMVE